MKPRHFLLVICISSCIFEVNGQDSDWHKSIKLSAEICTGNRFYDLKSIEFPTYSNDKKRGFSYGFLGRIQYESFYLSTGIFFTAQSFTLTDSLPKGIYLAPPVTQKSMSYLDIPVILGGNIKITKSLDLDLFAGYIGGILVKGNGVVIGIYPKYIIPPYPTEEGQPQFNEKVNSWCIGTGASYKLFPKLSIRLSGMYRIYNVIDKYYASTFYGNEKAFYHKYWNTMLGLQYQLK